MWTTTPTNARRAAPLLIRTQLLDPAKIVEGANTVVGESQGSRKQPYTRVTLRDLPKSTSGNRSQLAQLSFAAHKVGRAGAKPRP